MSEPQTVTPTDTSSAATTSDGGPSLAEFVASFDAAKATGAAGAPPASTTASGDAQLAAPAAPGAPTEAGPAKTDERPARTPEELYERIAAKDRAYQEQRNRARALEQEAQAAKAQFEQALSRFKSDPLAFAREHGVRFGDLAIAALGGDKGEPAKQDALALPDEVKAKLAKLDELESFVGSLKKEREEAAQRTQRDTAIGAVKGFLATRDHPLVNDLGLHDRVLSLVQAHIGEHGQFADDREAEEMVEFYAASVEKQERERLLGVANRPAIKSFLARELGLAASQNAASPARPEHQGASVRNTAPLTNRDVQERATIVPEGELSDEQRMQRTLEEISRMRAAAQQRA